MTYQEEHEQVLEELRERARKERAWLEPKVVRLRSRMHDLENRYRELQDMREEYAPPELKPVENMTVDELHSERHRLAEENWQKALLIRRLMRGKA